MKKIILTKPMPSTLIPVEDVRDFENIIVKDKDNVLIGMVSIYRFSGFSITWISGGVTDVYPNLIALMDAHNESTFYLLD